MRLVKQLGTVMLVSLLGSRAVVASLGHPWLTLALGVTTAVLVVLAYAWVVRRTEHRAPLEVGLSGAAAAIGRGTLIGVGTFTAVIGVIALFGGYRIDGWGSAEGAVGVLGFMTAAAVTEEVMFRGVLFRIVEERTGTWAALTLTGALFGLSHLLNPHASWWGAIAIAVEAGGMLAAAYAATRTLWVPIGLHFGWNVAEGGVFGVQVSGKSDSAGLLDGVISGPNLLGGGGFGPEASLAAVVACLVVTVLFVRLARRRGRMVPRRRRTAPAEPVGTLAP